MSVMVSGNQNSDFGYRVAQQLANANVDEAYSLFYDLRRKRVLHTAVQQMNQLLDDPNHEDLVLRAFRRIGLEHGG